MIDGLGSLFFGLISIFLFLIVWGVLFSFYYVFKELYTKKSRFGLLCLINGLILFLCLVGFIGFGNYHTEISNNLDKYDLYEEDVLIISLRRYGSSGVIYTNILTNSSIFIENVEISSSEYSISIHFQANTTLHWIWKHYQYSSYKGFKSGNFKGIYYQTYVLEEVVYTPSIQPPDGDISYSSDWWLGSVLGLVPLTYLYHRQRRR